MAEVTTVSDDDQRKLSRHFDSLREEVVAIGQVGSGRRRYDAWGLGGGSSRRFGQPVDPTFEDAGVMPEDEDPVRREPTQGVLEVAGGEGSVDYLAVPRGKGKADDGHVAFVDQDGQPPLGRQALGR